MHIKFVIEVDVKSEGNCDAFPYFGILSSFFFTTDVISFCILNNYILCNLFLETYKKCFLLQEKKKSMYTDLLYLIL